MANRKPLVQNSGEINEVVSTDSIAVGGVALATTGGDTVAEGKIVWDGGEGTAVLGLKGGTVQLQIGQEEVARVYNGTGSTLTSGQIVYIVGAQGNRPSVQLASNTAESTSSVTFGMVTETILNGAEGFITTAGIVNNLNTTGLTEGVAVWLGATAGTYTTTKPTAPAHTVLIGYVVRSHASVGSIFVHIQNGYELEELHDVSIVSKTDNDVLQYDSASGLWKNVAIGADSGIQAYDANTAKTNVVNTFSTNQIVSVNTTNPALRITQTGAGNCLVVEDSGNPDSTPFVIDANGKTVFGHTAALSGINALNANVQIVGNSADSTTLGLYSYRNSAQGPYLNFAHSKSAVNGSHAIANIGDDSGRFIFSASDGVAFIQNALIISQIDGTPGTNSMPGRVTISTNPGGKFTISSITRTANVVTVTTSTAVAGLAAVGNTVLIEGVTDTSFNGSFTVASIPTSTTFTFAQTATDASSSGGTATVQVTVPVERMRIDSAGRVGIGGTAPGASIIYVTKPMTGGIQGSVFSAVSDINSDVTNKCDVIQTYVKTQAATFTLPILRHFSAYQNTFGANSVVTTQVGFYAENTLTGATNNYGFFGNIPSGTGRWNFYAAGTAANYFAGNVRIGDPTDLSSSISLNTTYSTGYTGIKLNNTFTGTTGTINNTQFSSSPSVGTGAAITAIRHYQVGQGTFSGTVSNQFGFIVESSLTGAAANYGFFGNLASAANVWNFYANGTAGNYFNGQVTIGTTTPSASAKVQIDSTTQGFLPPRMTTAQRDAISSPEQGLIIHNITLNAAQSYNGSTWINLGIEGAGTGDMTKAVYDTDNDGIVDRAELADAVAWNNVTDKPTTFTPSTHTHAISDVTNLQSSLDGIAPAIGAITKDMSGWPDRTSTSISFDNATRTFTLSLTGGSATYYYRGEAKTLSSNVSFQIANTNGGRYIHLDPTNNTLYDGGTTGSYESAVLVGYVYWSVSDAAAFIVGDERHSSSRDTTWHLAQHLNVGTVWRSGGALSYTLDNASAVNIALGDITIADEDLIHSIVHAASPNGFYQQVLSGSASLPVLYYSGTEWRQFAATTVPWRPGTSLAQYNPISGGTGSLADATEGYYINYWVFATNDKNIPIKLIMGRTNNASIDAALTEEFSNLGLSLAENVPLYQIVLQTSSAYTGNTARVQVKQVRKIADRVSITSSSFSASSHSSLTNRSDNDSHPISAITGLQTDLDGKQATLVSGTNIKTINGSSVLGSGDLVVSGSASLSSQQAFLSADVQMPTSGTWYDGPSIELSEGTWLVNCAVTFRRTATTATQWISRISTGTTHYASGQAYTASVSGNTTQINLSVIVTLGSVTTVKIQSTTSAGATACLMVAATPNSGSGNNATVINAIKIA